MKQNKMIFLLSSLVALSSCNSQISSIESVSSELSSSESNEVSSDISSELSSELSSSEEKEIVMKENCFDPGKRGTVDFIYEDTIYVYKDEPYYLEKLFDFEVQYKTNMEEYLTISNDGIINVNKVDESKPVKGDLYIYNDNAYQKVTLVIDSKENGHENMNVDVARLYNSNVIFFGDSITHNWLKYPSGNETPVNNVSGYKYGELGYENNYIVQITKKAQLKDSVNVAWSGGTVAYYPRSKDRPTYKSLVMSVVNHEQEIKNADYAFIFYGTNDYTDQVEIGELGDPIDITSKKNASFKTSYDFALTKMFEYNPNIKVIALNIMYRTYPASGSFFTMKKYNEAINEVCAKHHVKVLDMFSIFNKDNFKAGGVYTEDGLHPNDEGYNVMTSFILSNGKNK